MPQQTRLSAFVAELRRRRVFRVAAIQFLILASMACTSTAKQSRASLADRPAVPSVNYPITSMQGIQKHLKRVEPLLQGNEMVVMIRAYIDSTGNVVHAFGPKEFVEIDYSAAAVAAVREAEWQPARIGGRTAGMWIHYPVVFGSESPVDTSVGNPDHSWVPYDTPPSPSAGIPL